MIDPFAFLPGALGAVQPATVPKCAKGVTFPASYMENPDARYLGTSKAEERRGLVPVVVGLAVVSLGVWWVVRSGVLNANPLDGEARRRGVTAADVDPEQLRVGTEHELEHARDRATARQIALDHLAEVPDYYTRLRGIESFRVGDRVRVRGTPHGEGQAVGTIREVDGVAYAIRFDGSRKIHRWYVGRELEPVRRDNVGILETAIVAGSLGAGTALAGKGGRKNFWEDYWKAR